MSHDLWPFDEAQKLAGKVRGQRKKAEESGEPVGDPTVLFETGFGPSGLPHLGHFSENLRTTWVRRAFERLADEPTELVVFSDDMDGLRSVPDNLPGDEMLGENLGRPLCDVPDPFGEANSYAAHMNARLREFLDSFGFDYTFKSSAAQYRDGVFDEGLLAVLDHYDEVRDAIVSTLREENREGWSPFFPICEECGKVYTTRVVEVDRDGQTVSYACDDEFRGMTPCGDEATVPVTGGAVKVGWKVDWALRWYTFDVDYEMYGKDLIDPAKLSGSVVEILGGQRPLGFFYEMFLDEEGRKISSSEGGGGLTIDEWLSYAPLESLAWFLFQNPQKAKKLHFDVIPRSVDSWLEAREEFGELDDPEQQLANPVWFVESNRIDAGESVAVHSDITYTKLLNLVSALNTDDREVVWEYLRDDDPAVGDDRKLVDELVDGALNYFRDFVVPEREFRSPPEELESAVREFRDFLADYDGDDAEEIQNAAYEYGKKSEASLGDWFQALYRMLLGEDEGPRLGSFIALIGVDETVEKLDAQLGE